MLTIEEDKLLDINNNILRIEKQINNIGSNTSNAIRDEIELRRAVIEETYTASKSAKQGQIESLRDAGSGTLVDQSKKH